MFSNNLSQSYRVRPLTLDDSPEILALYQTNPLYFEHYPPQPSLTSVASDLTKFPPSKKATDKAFLGFFDGETLLGVLDLIRDYPQEGTVYLGLFMVHAAYQGQGLSSQLLTEVLSALGADYQKARLSYVATNPQASQFWTKQGFIPTGERIETGDIEIVVAEKHLRQE